MGKTIITPEMISDIRSMIDENSYSEIAEKLNIHRLSVINIIKKENISRSKNAEYNIRSRIRKRLVKSERRRAIFGFDQHTNLKVFSNPVRKKLKYCLRRKKYIFLSRGAMTAYYSNDTIRSFELEERGRKVGLKFESLNQ